MIGTTYSDSFKTLSTEITRSFLQTVMVVDDEAYYGSLESVIKASSPIVTEVKKPGRIRRKRLFLPLLSIR